MIRGLALQNQIRTLNVDVHHFHETTDALALVMTVDIVHDPAIRTTEGERGAGLEIAVTAIEIEGIETGVVPETGREVSAETVVMIDEVSANLVLSTPSMNCLLTFLRSGYAPKGSKLRDRSRSQSPARNGMKNRSRSRSPRPRGFKDDRRPGRKDPRARDDGRQANGAPAAGRYKEEMEVDFKEDADEEEMEEMMRRSMGFTRFRTTKNTKVPGNDIYGVRKEKTTKYRQYMNRTGGFNRPLSPSR